MEIKKGEQRAKWGEHQSEEEQEFGRAWEYKNLPIIEALPTKLLGLYFSQVLILALLAIS